MSDRQVVAHLLRRATFGPTAAEVDAAEAAGFEATLAGLATTTGEGLTLPALGADPYAGLATGAGRAARTQANSAAHVQVQALIQWWVAQMAAAPHQLAEKLVFFWHGHWATNVQKVKSATLMLGQLQTFRQYGSGDFTVLLKAMLRDPALIVWLDGQDNTAKAPNENLGRELMELFTLGIGNYTENDVKAAARALTGWTFDRGNQRAVFVPRRHDSASKTILGQTAAFDTDSYADLLVAQPANAVFLAKRLWYRFASGDPLPAATQDRLVAAYRPARDVTALIRALFADDGFAATRGHLVKQPVEWLVGALRQLGIQVATDGAAIEPAAATTATLSDGQRKQLLAGLDGLGQVPLRPPSVGGWPAAGAWLTTSSLQVRLRLAAALAAAAGPSALAPVSSGSAADKLDGLARLLAVDAWTDRTRAVLSPAAANPRQLLALGLASPEYTVS